jgi:5-methyltetrahydrofolate--homocysteine methyltransferase
MKQIGTGFKKGEIFLPAVLITTRAMQLEIAQLKPASSDSSETNGDEVVIGTAEGALHGIGKT